MQVWIHCYNEHMEMPYQRMGHYFLAAVYAVMLYVSSSMYGSLRLGYFRNGELIYTHTLATICANAVSYIPIVLLVKHFKNSNAVGPYDSRAVCDHLYLGISGKWDLQEAVSAQKGDHDIWRTPGGGSYE